MGNDLPGKIFGIIMGFILCVVMPFVNTASSQEMDNRRLVIEDVSDFLDSVCDGRVISEAEISALNARLSSYGMILDYDIHRYARTVNPDYTGHDYVVDYVEVDDITTYNKGDKIIIHVYEVSNSSTISLSRKMVGLFVSDFDLTIAARVR